MRLCPDEERDSICTKAAEAAQALEPIMNPIGHMQRGVYFQILGDEAAELEAWHKTIQWGGGGLFTSYFAAAMLSQGRSAEALEVLTRSGLASDKLSAISQAFLLLDNSRPDQALALYRVAAASPRLRVLAETVLLLAGDGGRVAANSAQLLDVMPPEHPDYQALRCYAGRVTAEELDAAASSSKLQASGTDFLVGMSFLSRGERDAAKKRFKRSVGAGTHWQTQYRWSRAFLARMERDPHWPPWIPGSRSPRPASESPQRSAPARDAAANGSQ